MYTLVSLVCVLLVFQMSIREKILWKLATRAKLIAGLASLACMYFLCVLPNFSNFASVEEDTIYPGGTFPFVSIGDVPHEGVSSTELSVVAGDGRECLVYVFMGDEAVRVGKSVYESVRRARWLSKTIYFLFPSKSFHVQAWLFRGPVEIVRGAFVLDSRQSGPLQLSVEGKNGILPNEDWGNALFEVAAELGIPVKVRSVYESIFYQASNGGMDSPHSVFLDRAIPSLTLFGSIKPASHAILQIAQLVGKHLRAVSAMHHQLHHGTSLYFYTAPSREISMGLFLPLLIGLFSPLIVAAVDVGGHTELPVYSIAILGHVLWGIVAIGVSSYLSVINAFGASRPGYCESSPGSFEVFPTLWVTFTVLLIVAHVHISSRINAGFDSDNPDSVYDYPQTLHAGIHKAYTLVLVSLTILHWSLALVITLCVLPVILQNSKKSFLFSILAAGIVFYIGPEVLTGTSDLVVFLKNVKLGDKPLAQHVYESVCMSGLALPVFVGTLVPAVVLMLEVFLAEPRIQPTTKLPNRSRIYLLSIACIILIAREVYYSE